MASTTLRFLSLLLFVLPASHRDYYVPTASIHRPANHAVQDERYPIVLVPGGSCSELEVRLTDAYRPAVPRCGAMKGKGWFGLWHNSSDDLAAHDYLPCFMEQMSLVYNADADDYRSIQGVETRVRNFGTSTGFHSNPNHLDWCLGPLRHELEKIGYRDGTTLFGAPYDLRRVPPIPGHPSRVYSDYFRQLTSLIERASAKNKHKKVILFGQSQGGMVALEFLRAMPPSWRDKHIKHLVLVSPLPASAGFAYPVKNIASGSVLLDVPNTTLLSLRPMWRTFESALFGFPSPAVFMDDRPVVITRRRNYTSRDMEDLLVDVGAGSVVEPFRKRQLPRWRRFQQPPMVPVTCINGVGSKTPEQFVYWDADFDREPEVVYGDGDGVINLAGMLAFDEEMTRHPEQRELYKAIKLHGASHSSLAAAEWSLKRVIQEILEASNPV